MTDYASSSVQAYQRSPGLLAKLGLDGPLTLGLIAICGFGLYVLYSAGGQDLGRVQSQSIRLAVGFALMLAVAWMSPTWIRRLTPLGYAFGIMLLLGVMFFGTGAKGAQLGWLCRDCHGFSL